MEIPIEPAKKVMTEEDNEPEVEGCVFGNELGFEQINGPSRLTREYQ